MFAESTNWKCDKYLQIVNDHKMVLRTRILLINHSNRAETSEPLSVNASANEIFAYIYMYTLSRFYYSNTLSELPLLHK